MKKVVMFVLLSTMSVVGLSQIKDIKVNDQITVDRVYAGIMSGSYFSVDSLNIVSFVDLRLGAMATYKPAKWISVKSFCVYNMQTKTEPFGIIHFWVKLNPTEKFSLEAGNMATLPTEQRPHPVSGDGQFETFAEAQIVGMALGAKMKYQFNPDFKIGAGIADRKGPEYSGMFNYKKITLSGWYTDKTQKAGSALTLDFERIYSVLVWRQDQTISNIFCFKIPKHETLSLYADDGYNLVTGDLVRGEYGILKNFSSTHFSGLLGFGYVTETRSVAGYLFLHL
ncbi:MAG: hypothetical protein NT068_03545 [Candidatus Nomurabacteria bacterium]|nr:hypothetical protein [Candidatus Nomurabacteria bacterium]